MLELTRQDYEAIVKHAWAGRPNEVCGLLGGVMAVGGVNGEEKRIVRQVYHLTNVDDSPMHFSLDPREQFAAVRDMRQKGLALLGNYHSHPASPARPSAEDIRLAFDSELSYVILSLVEGNKPVLRSFRIRGGAVEEEKIVIREDQTHAGD